MPSLAPLRLETTDNDRCIDVIEAAIAALPKPGPNAVWTTRQRRALVVGGTRGIGRALATLLGERGWFVDAPGRGGLNMLYPESWPLVGAYDFVAFCAGALKPFPWDRKSPQDYVDSYWVHALGPVAFLAGQKAHFPWWCKVAFISSVGAINDGICDLGYGMAKAALDKAARALEEHEAWQVFLVRFDLVETDTFYQLPVETLHGRPVLSPEEAARRIVEECSL